eukprot:174245-Amphidinium_carterae.1
MFCVSDRHLKYFVIFVGCGACFFSLAACASIGRLQATVVHGPSALVRSAWYETSPLHGRFLVCSCGLLIMDRNIVPRLCTVVSDHLHLNFFSDTWSKAWLVGMMHIWMGWTAGHFYRRHARRMLTMTSCGSAQPSSGSVFHLENENELDPRSCHVF